METAISYSELAQKRFPPIVIVHIIPLFESNGVFNPGRPFNPRTAWAALCAAFFHLRLAEFEMQSSKTPLIALS